MTEHDKDCLKCSLKYCTPECFDSHPGSAIALGKLVNKCNDKKGIKVYIAGRN